MKELADVLAELVKQGGPLAHLALVLHYTRDFVNGILTAGVIGGALFGAYKLISRGIRVVERREEQ